MYCNATQAQLSGDYEVTYKVEIFGQENPQNSQVTENAINCCLRCAFTGNCNIWVSPARQLLPLSIFH